MSNSYTVWVPLPPKELGANFRGHTMAKAVWVRRYREACGFFYRRANIPRLDGVVLIHLDFYLAPRKAASGQVIKDNCYRPRDEDDARYSFKAGQDALKDAGIIVDDTKKFVRCGVTTIHSKAKEHEGKTGVLVTLVLLPKSAKPNK